MLQSLASDKISEAEAVAAMYRNTTPTLLDVTQSEEKLNKLIQQHDVVIRWGYGYVEFPLNEGGGGGIPLLASHRHLPGHHSSLFFTKQRITGTQGPTL